MLRKIKIKSNVNRLKSAMHCQNVINTEKTGLDKITLSLSPWQSQIKDFMLADREFDLTGDTHHCFWSWWASPRSCSAPTGRNVPQTWSLLDYFLRSKVSLCSLRLLVTAELAQCLVRARLSWSESVRSRHQYWARPGTRRPERDTLTSQITIQERHLTWAPQSTLGATRRSSRDFTGALRA